LLITRMFISDLSLKRSVFMTSPSKKYYNHFLCPHKGSTKSTLPRPLFELGQRLGYGLDDRRKVVRFPAEARDLSLL